MRRPPPTPVPRDELAPGPQPYFLLVDERFRVPIFVFVEIEPQRPARAVTIRAAPVGRGTLRYRVSLGPATCLGRDPADWDRFQEFPSDGHARAAGFAPVEPRYVGPSWESYVSAFRPEGERPVRPAGG